MNRKISSRTTGARSARRTNSGNMLVGIFVGLVLGLVVAFGIAWYINRTPFPFQNKWGTPAGETSEAGKLPAPVQSDTPSATALPAPLPGKPGDKPLEKPRFDFYKILPEGEQASPAPAPTPQTAETAGVPFYLQVGSFQNPSDADNLKAKLALMGLEASVMQADLPDRGTVHRVRIGPFERPEEMNLARTELAQNGIQASVVRGRQ